VTLTSSSHATAPLDLDAIRSELSGQVLGPDDEGYDDARQVMYGDLHPAAVIRAADVADVQTVIRLAARTGLELAVRSGGHSGAGHSSTEGGIVLDLRELKAIDVDVAAKTATAQTGLTASEVNAATGEHGLVIGFGDTGSVGIGGIVTGGGVGYLVRKYGLTIDNVLAAQVVTADGEIHDVDAEHEPDLFWAIRGGGGNFGVVTRFTFQLHELPQITGGMILIPATPESVSGFVDAILDGPEELSGIGNVMPTPPMPFLPESVHGKLAIMAIVAYAGTGEAAEQALAPIRALGEPYADMLAPIPYAQLFPPEDPSYRPKAVSRNLFTDRIDRDTAALILQRLQESDAPLRAAQLRPLGGAEARVPADATAYAHRGPPVMVNIAAFHHGDDDKAAKEAWVVGLTRELAPTDHSSYVNFLVDEGPDRVRDAYPGPTWDRLVAIKRRYDPTNLFHRNQNIPPA
jgi:FAD/FMN-containing dehydrogenase